MSLSVTLGTALTGLRVNQKAIEVASQNVANASTVGYSRQVVQREALTTGGMGSGVGVAAVSRTVDDFLIREIRTQNAAVGAESVRGDYLARTQDLFGTLANDTSLTARLTSLANGIGALANQPESAAQRLSLVQAAEGFAQALRDASTSIQSMRQNVERDLDQGVKAVNSQLDIISELNRQIVHRQALGESPNELLDKRDSALATLAEYVDVQSFTRETGEIVVYTRSGKPLVDGSPHLLSYDAAAAVGVDTTFDAITLDGKPIGASLQSGKLTALVEMRDKTLPGLQSQMDALAEKVRDQVNLAHNRGTAVPAPSALQGTRVFGDVNAEQITVSSPVRIAAVDAAGVIQAYTDLPAGSYTVAPQRDAVNAGLGGAVTATAADGKGFGLAAAAGLGVAVVDLAGAAPDATVTHTVAGATREYRGLSNFLGLNDMFVTPGRSTGDTRSGIAGTIAVRSDIAANPSALARGGLTTVAAPQAGVTVGLTPGATDTLTGIAAALDTKIAFGAIGGLPAFTGTVTDYATQIISANAQQASAASNRADYANAVLSDLSNRAGSISGVNIDEEMANLIASQNAYAASARLVTVVSEMLELLVNLR